MRLLTCLQANLLGFCMSGDSSSDYLMTASPFSSFTFTLMLNIFMRKEYANININTEEYIISVSPAPCPPRSCRAAAASS
jgi:hypothetical protein